MLGGCLTAEADWISHHSLLGMQGTGRGVLHGTWVLEGSPLLELPPVLGHLCPQRQLFSRSPSISTGTPLMPLWSQGDPQPQTSLTAGWPTGGQVGTCGEYPPSWNLPLTMGSASSCPGHLPPRCAWQVSIVLPQLLPLLQGGILQRRHSETCLRHLSRVGIISRYLLISCNLALPVVVFNQSAWLYVLKGKGVLSIFSPYPPPHICYPQSYTKTFKLGLGGNRTRALSTRH